VLEVDESSFKLSGERDAVVGNVGKVVFDVILSILAVALAALASRAVFVLVGVTDASLAARKSRGGVGMA